MRLYVAGRDPSKAAELSASARATGHFGSHDEAIADPRVDVALVATPPASHLALTLAALREGKHVIVEKPAFPRSADFDHVGDAASHAARRVLVAENYFYKPLLARLRDVVQSGELGQVRFVQINAVKRQPVDGWRGDPDVAGGGALFEGGIHWVSFMANLGLSPCAVAGHMPGSLPGFERSAVLVLDYAEGAVGVLSYSWEIPGMLRGLRLSRVWGTRGSVLFESNGVFLLRTGGRPSLGFPGLRDIAGYRPMFADLLSSIVEGRPARFTFEHARRDVELVERAYANALHESGAIP